MVPDECRQAACLQTAPTIPPLSDAALLRALRLHFVPPQTSSLRQQRLVPLLQRASPGPPRRHGRETTPPIPATRRRSRQDLPSPAGKRKTYPGRHQGHHGQVAPRTPRRASWTSAASQPRAPRNRRRSQYSNKSGAAGRGERGTLLFPKKTSVAAHQPVASTSHRAPTALAASPRLF